VITDLLALSGISRRKIECQKVDMSEMVQRFISELKTSAPQREVKVQIQSGLMVNADPGLLKILVENLIRNAWKFTSKREISHIELGESDKDSQHWYFLRDNGVGFDMKESAKLFTPYERLHSSQEFKGNGIGLAIAKRIVEKHGGSIWAEGEKDKGATFYFQLP
jgi:light-regulated signal transduction histidine kinase (bacteriophytochrome)